MVDSNADIANLKYVIQPLKGEVRRLYESVDIEANKYAIVWDALQKRYANRHFLKNSFYVVFRTSPWS